MKLIPRSLDIVLREKLTTSNKGVVVYGARQVGKTTLSNNLIKNLGLRALTISGDQSSYIDILSSRDVGKIRSLLEGYELLFVDEAQRIPEVGLALKIILDSIPHVKVLVTGSSSLDLASKISEPLTGRIWTYHLYPISFLELSQTYNKAELHNDLETRLVYGSYPEIFSLPGHDLRYEYLRDLTDAYLYKDLLEFGGIKNSTKIRDLLKLLAFQIGSQVSLSELSSALGMAKETVSRYIDLLEKSYVIFRLSGLSRNLRKEITKMDKIFFYDLGVRNVLIDNLKSIKDRDDVGKLWENLLIIERMKKLAYTQVYSSTYYWRTYTGAELDYVEERNGTLFGYEFKWGNKTSRPAKSWKGAYPSSEYLLVNQDNYLDFIL